jgi:DNA (cytosine-5)-methyltransferase 1
MRYISLFSGIEAASVGWHDLGWDPVVFADFDEFPSAVLNHHYPQIENVGDVMKHEWKQHKGKCELIVGGSPCQSFSVAGHRLGMDDPRGNLALKFLQIVRDVQPRWFIYENVPGLLSSGGGQDFATFLGEVAECGYGFAYRVLDAQNFGVPQRRRRVFVVGHIDGDWRSAAAVLFESTSVCGDTKASKEAGQDTTLFTQPSLEGTGRQVSTEGIAFDWKNIRSTRPSEESTDPLTVEGGIAINQQAPYHDPAPTLDASYGTGAGMRAGIERQVIGVRQGSAEGSFGTFEDSDIGAVLKASGGVLGGGSETIITETFTKGGHGVFEQNEDTLGTLPANEHKGAHSLITSSAGVVTKGNGEAWETDERHMSLTSGGGQAGQGYPAVRQSVFNIDSQSSNSIKSGNPKSGSQEIDKASTLTTFPPSPEGYRGGNAVVANHVVRRLTPVECERLQGFPDNYTQIPYKGKPAEDCPKTHRYKALGNSMAVPVMKWLGERIQQVSFVKDGLETIPESKTSEQKTLW